MRALFALLLLAGCGGEGLAPGDLGTARLFGEVRGAPIRARPPVRDREGNVYVLTTLDDQRADVRVGYVAGGWSSSCSVEAGGPVHGFAGTATDRAWLWSGRGLYEISGKSGGCQRILERDPNTRVALTFAAVLPGVRATPSRTTLVAVVTALEDRGAYVAVVDLATREFRSVRRVLDAIPDVRVLGAGPGVVAVAFGTEAQLWQLDDDGATRNTVDLDEPDRWSESPLVGGILTAADGTIAALRADGALLVMSAQGVRKLAPPSGMTPVGLHESDGRLYLVGQKASRPLVAPVGASGLGAAATWDSAAALAERLAAGLPIVDERTKPVSRLSWDSARSALGELPFVTPDDPVEDASGVAGFLVAGPRYESAGITVSQVAYVPVGIAYP